MTVCPTIPLATRSGIELDVRPATADDEAALGSFFERVSQDDRRFRFLAAADHVGHQQLAPLVEADHFRSESYIAFNRASGQIVASGLLACDGPLENAEIAISVCQNHRGKGVGWAMLDLLAQKAEQRGVRRAIAIESRDNHAAIEMERERGFVPEAFEGDPNLVTLVKTFR